MTFDNVIFGAAIITLALVTIAAYRAWGRPPQNKEK